MESSSPLIKASEPPPHRWSKIAGTTIAVITLALPLSIIAYFSPPHSVESSPHPPYSVYNPHR